MAARPSPVSRVWTLAVSHPVRAVRVCCMATIYAVMLLRALALYKREAAAVVAAELALCLAAGWAALPVSAAAAALLLLELARREPEANLGHRAGAEGYDGRHFENTIGALDALLARDGGAEGPLADLKYVEFDVQETSDGRLIVLHDAHIMPRSFPPAGPNLGPLRALELLPPEGAPGAQPQQQQRVRQWRRQQQQQQQQHEEVEEGAPPPPPGEGPFESDAGCGCSGGGVDAQAEPSAAPVFRPGSNLVCDRTLAELRSLHLGAREGVRAPTLREFLAAARRGGCAAPVVIEVKALRSDAGRRELVEAVREHAPFAQRMAAAHPRRAHPGFGFLSIIAFPNHYAASFGELGSPACARWTRELVGAGASVRACVFWQLNYARALGAAL